MAFLPQTRARALGRIPLAGIVLTLTVTFASVAEPATIDAATPPAPQPLPGYQPAFVTERDGDVWQDCVWASAAMLLDKWSNGATIVGRQRLRALSGDKEGGSNLADVQRAFAKLGYRLWWSPYAGYGVSWSNLLERLAGGGGAILVGDYGKLPAQYGRWDRNFWSRTGAGDDHALYLDRYDSRTGRVLVMDPLAPGGWSGEWMPVSALRKFAWQTSWGALWTAMTPPALTSPFDDVSIGTPAATADGSALHIAWPISETPAGWAYPGASVLAEVERLGAVDPMAWIVGAAPVTSVADAPPGPTASLQDGLVHAAIPLPSAPGIYAVTAALADPYLGQPFAEAGPINLYVPGPRAAAYQAPASMSVAAGKALTLPIRVTNVGSQSWAELPLVPWMPLSGQSRGGLHLTATWVRQASALAGESLPRPPAPFSIATLFADVGDSVTVNASLQAPIDAGTWRLLLDLVDDAGDSLALSGSAPATIAVDVVNPGQSSTDP